MSKEERESLTRSKARKQRSDQRKKMDRLLNVLIAVVSILIIINLMFVLKDKDKDKEVVKNESSEQSKDADTKTNTTNTTTSDEKQQKEETNDESTKKLDTDQISVSASNDPVVEEVIVNSNWQPTPTKQTDTHVSTYEEGQIDYEEKLITFQNAVNLSDENIIYWSVKNNGSSDTAIAVVSSNDKEHSEKYRVSIQWIDNQGWKPVKVEKLKRIEGSY